MSKDSKKFFEPRPNYAAYRKWEEENYHKPTNDETRQFLEFWQEIYDIWLKNNSPFESRYVEDKVKLRKELIEKFGIKT